MTKFLLALLFAFSSSVFGWCQTVMIPESNGTGGQLTIYPGSNYIVNYYRPGNASSAGIEFWTHQFSANAPNGSQHLLAYINSPTYAARRFLNASNEGIEAGTGLNVNFPISTFLNPGEWLVVNWQNDSGVVQGGALVVTIQECYG